MLQRYIGNKNALIEAILEAVQQNTKPGDLVCDAFSGSVAVSVALKAAGYRVATNDVNLLSWVYAVTYLKNSCLPPIDLKELTGQSKWSKREDSLSNWTQVFEHLVSPQDRRLPKKAWRTDFFDHYCEKGACSGFKSSRGRVGKRRFFSPENAKAIDRALSRVRWWLHSGLIDNNRRCILTASLLDGIEKVSNTQGTYHDFPREFYDSRALRPIRINLPHLNSMKGRTDHIVGRGEDSFDFVQRIPKHSLLYLDPPYNFRQYTSYYFLPNLVARYPEIESLDEYFSEINFVRGQNMEDDFTSTFCKPAKFMSSLEEIILRSRCRTVLMSYFDGKNHWSGFKEKPDHRGRRILEKFFQGDLFIPRSAKRVPIERLNYQSYGGYSARNVTEYLFSAQRNPSNSRSGRKKKVKKYHVEYSKETRVDVV